MSSEVRTTRPVPPLVVKARVFLRLVRPIVFVAGATLASDAAVVLCRHHLSFDGGTESNKRQTCLARAKQWAMSDLNIHDTTCMTHRHMHMDTHMQRTHSGHIWTHRHNIHAYGDTHAADT